ncbi:MAG TPA: thioredoxin-like domain-containing protein [Candidatus Binatia bacterium]|jgi:DNA-binding beta-propeller fold protein YncE|nr:thioredoxin-like domain-containing protein [Candidatus Binatia bacterium]
MAQERVHAPELEGGVAWLNTAHPLTLTALKGKVVLLDFWTYCCINCMHIIPDLKKLEAQYPTQLVVIGVHSAKFPNERESDNIRQAILRYEIEHPVVNDAEFRIWRRYGVRSWPTRVLIDPEGYVVGGVSGEGHYETFDRIIGGLIADHRARGTLNEEPLALALEKARFTAPVLSFPGKVLADPQGDRLFIADSNHNRLLVTSKAGQVLDVAGSGEIGAADGAFAAATFNHPQGMALDGDLLYVADTENHLIRRLDLRARTVTTIAGTGAQALGNYRRGPAREVDLSSPWDVVLGKGILYIAMAGPHQIWAMNLQHEEIGPYAGSGREARIDGPLMQAALAQPSGITSDGTNLYVADSEISSIRAVSLNPKGQVTTIVGLDLFEFGDVDGQGETVRLQHPLGVTHHNRVLYVADTYNHKIKAIGPRLATAATFLGTGKPGFRDGELAQFYEPGGVSVADGKLYIADTNNHAIRVADLHTKQVTTLQLTGLTNGATADMADVWPNLEEVRLPSQTLRSGQSSLVLDVKIPAPYKLNPGSPLEYRLEVNGASAQQGKRTSVRDGRFPLQIPLSLTADKAEVHVALSFVYCRNGNEGECVIKSLRWTVPVQTAGNGSEELRIEHTLAPEQLQNEKL